MSVGKYSPHVRTGGFAATGWKEGTEGRVEVASDGFDWYGYDENGKDVAGMSEQDYFDEYVTNLRFDQDLSND